MNYIKNWLMAAYLILGALLIVGCNNGGGGSGTPSVNCNVPQNYNTDLLRRRRLSGPAGISRRSCVGTFLQGLPSAPDAS